MITLWNIKVDLTELVKLWFFFCHILYFCSHSILGRDYLNWTDWRIIINPETKKTQKYHSTGCISYVEVLQRPCVGRDQLVSEKCLKIGGWMEWNSDEKTARVSTAVGWPTCRSSDRNPPSGLSLVQVMTAEKTCSLRSAMCVPEQLTCAVGGSCSAMLLDYCRSCVDTL